MADLKLTYSFVPQGQSAADLRSLVEGYFKEPISVKFTADTSGLTGKNGIGNIVGGLNNGTALRGLTSVNDALKMCQVELKGVAGVKKLYSAETAREASAMKLAGQQYDVTAKRFRSETAEINRNNAAKRTANMEQKAADQAANKSAAKERKQRQETLDFKYLKRQSEDYFNTYQKGILKNKELTAAWADFNKQTFKDPLDKRTALQEMMARTREAGAEVETLGNRIKRLFGQHFDTALVMVGINALRQALVQVYQNVVQLDKAVVDLQIATGGSRSEMQALLSDYSKLGQEIGATTLEVAQSSDTFLRQGKTLAETDTLIRNSMMLSKLGQITSQESSAALTSAMKGYKVSVEDSLGIVDKLTAVDLNAATSAGDLAVAMQQTAVSADLAGLSMDKLIGQLAVIMEVTQQGPEQIGNFQKTMLSRMGNIKQGILLDPEDGSTLSNVESVLTGYGIKLRDSNSEFRNFGDVLDEVASKWDSYGSVAQRAIASAFAGVRQQERFQLGTYQWRHWQQTHRIAGTSLEPICYNAWMKYATA